jgi:hypothetical protein
MSVRRHVECLARLNELTGSTSTILQFLAEEKLIGVSLVKEVSNSPDKAKELYVLLQGLHSEDKLQLLSYEWQVLPIERIRIHIITNRSNKEFDYNF